MRERRRRTAWSITYVLLGAVCLLVAVTMAAGFVKQWPRAEVGILVPVLLLGVPGAVMTFRAPVFGVSYGPAGVRYTGLLGSRSYAWAEIREVRVAVLKGKVYTSDVPELVLASGGTDQLLMLAGHSSGRSNRRVGRLVADLESARAAAS
ncbi:hypothetical protein [Kitasatospora sp. NPDC101183]|uniref:hypothetical protein n=1 Tax=Kitasatospora sp. NPDC101183 TaxID=3364100 RepID=UPI00380A1230